MKKNEKKRNESESPKPMKKSTNPKVQIYAYFWHKITAAGEGNLPSLDTQGDGQTAALLTRRGQRGEAITASSRSHCCGRSLSHFCTYYLSPPPPKSVELGVESVNGVGGFIAELQLSVKRARLPAADFGGWAGLGATAGCSPGSTWSTMEAPITLSFFYYL